jgi:hypothetical protein
VLHSSGYSIADIARSGRAEQTAALTGGQADRERARRLCTKKHSIYAGRSLAPEENPEPARNPGFLSRCLILGGSSGGRVSGDGVPPDPPTVVECDQPFRSCAAATRSFHGARWELEPRFPNGSKVTAARTWWDGAGSSPDHCSHGWDQ